MNISDYRNAIRQDLFDITPTTQYFNDAAVDRAIISALEDLSRWVPDRQYMEIVADSADKTQTFSSTSIVTTSSIILTHAPVKYGSDSITNGSISYTRGTDYNIDHTTGTITFPLGSAIIALADGITLTITYQKSRRQFLLSIPNLRGVESVTLWNASQAIADIESFELIGNYLNYIRNNSDIDSGNRLLVSYSARYTIPEDNEDGTLPEALSELVIKGAGAALLFAKAIGMHLSQSSNFNDLSSTASSLANLVLDLQAARDNLASALVRAGIEASIIATTGASIADDITAQDALITSINTFLTNVTTNLTSSASFVDTEVPADIAAAIVYLTTAADGKLTDISNQLAAALVFIDTEVNTDLGNASTALQTTGEGYLGNGDTFIETVNAGRDPAGEYRAYAEAEFKKAEGNVAVGMGRLNLAKSYLDQTEVKVKTVEANLGQAATILKNAETRLSLAGLYSNYAETQIKAAQGKIAEAELYNNRIQARLLLLRAYIEDVGLYISIAQGYSANGQIIVSSINAQIAIAAEVRQQGVFIIDLAERLRAEAVRRYRDFQEGISDKSQTRRTNSSVASKQAR